NWLTDSPVWVDQWMLNKQKLKALTELVEEQLAKGNIEETNSPWNSPVFVIKKTEKDKWRLLHNLRKIIEVIEDMGPLQLGMPLPTMLPQNWNLAAVDIKDCFFQIPLHPVDAQRFAFSVPSIKREAPMKRYHWKILPQGMKNSPTICQCLIIAWVFLGHQLSKNITRPQELMARLISKARVRMQLLAGCDFTCIHLPITLLTGKLTNETLEQLLRENERLQFALDSYTGKILIHCPGYKLFNSQFNLIPKDKQSRKPLKALTIFTDTSGRSHKSLMTWKDPQTQLWETDVEIVEGSSQIAQLAAVVRAFERFSEPINIVTDSAYAAGVVARAQNAVLKEVSNPVLFGLLSKLIYLVSHGEQPFFIMHVRSHTDLP
ncbi:PO113 protein, partial [Polioptila caerulea]|nr:PO113 protein [Polioptila caerulea]